MEGVLLPPNRAAKRTYIRHVSCAVSIDHVPHPLVPILSHGATRDFESDGLVCPRLCVCACMDASTDAFVHACMPAYVHFNRCWRVCMCSCFHVCLDVRECAAWVHQQASFRVNLSELEAHRYTYA